MSRIAPETLRWARESAGLSVAEAARRLGFRDGKKRRASERLAAYENENGCEQPSLSVLNTMARVYRRSLLTLYLEKPPPKSDRGEDFRTLTDADGAQYDGLVDAVIRDISVRQSILKDALIDEGDGHECRFIGSMALQNSPQEIAASLAETLDFDRDRFRKEDNTSRAFDYLRQCAEGAGIFVLLVDNLGSHHTTIPLEAFRGFALADTIAPFVAVNANDAKGAWAFTLLHEIAHLWLGKSGVSGMPDEHHQVESLCNAVAAEMLLSRRDLPSFSAPVDWGEAIQTISQAAQDCKVSSTMVSYALLRADKITAAQYSSLSSQFRESFLQRKEQEKARNKEKSGGPSYITVKRQRLGNSLISTIERMLYSGVLTTTKSARVLGVKPLTVGRILDPERADKGLRVLEVKPLTLGPIPDSGRAATS